MQILKDILQFIWLIVQILVATGLALALYMVVRELFSDTFKKKE